MKIKKLIKYDRLIRFITLFLFFNIFYITNSAHAIYYYEQTTDEDFIQGVNEQTVINGTGESSMLTLGDIEYFTEHIIDADFIGATGINLIDLNNDGYRDVLATSILENEIVWYENDGQENFTKHSIDSAFDTTWSVYGADIDGDDIIDVLASSRDLDEIAWYKNDGNENFTKNVIDNTFIEAHTILAVDLNEDGHMDVLGESWRDNTIAWYQNDGNENFTKHIIDSDIYRPRATFFADLDKDNEIDVVGAASYGNEITWYQNDGNENFTENFVYGGFTRLLDVYVSDLNNDNENDILSATYFDSEVAWFENDGNENFTKYIIDDSFSRAYSVRTFDFENDGDYEVVAIGESGLLAWYENYDNGNFTKHSFEMSMAGGRKVEALDINQDGYDDFAATATGGLVAWFENNAGEPAFGTYTSQIFNPGDNSTFFYDISWNSTTPSGTSIGVKVRTGNMPDLSDAKNWSECSFITNGSTMSFNDCVNDGNKYIQYYVELNTNNNLLTPSLNDITLTYDAFIDNDNDGYRQEEDCNDNDKFIHPNAPERCNNLDDNCDGDSNDEALMTTWYYDPDNDGFGIDETGFCVDPPKDYATDNGDCNNNDNTIYPGAPEIPNDGIDQNCDGRDIEASIISGTLYRSTHIEKTKKGFRKEKQRTVCLFSKHGAIKECDKTNDRGKFRLEGITPNKTYYLASSSKKPVTRSYFFERMEYYKKKYQPTFGDLWKKKFTDEYRIKKAKNKGYPYDVKYYRKYKGVKEINTSKDLDVDLYLR